MKRYFPGCIGLALGTVLTCAGAYADEPCPGGESDSPTEKCKTDLSNILPPVFVFPEDSEKNDAEPAPAAENGSAPSAENGSAPAAEAAAETERGARILPETCTYSAYAWDTKKKRASGHFKVSKPYAEVTDDERDPNAPQCTICIEDQVEIDPSEFGVKADKIRICHAYAPQVKKALAEIAASGRFDIEKLEGYRPGRTRGKIDEKGLRTEWSNHSFGTAIDINAHRNAIYSSCPGALTDDASQVASCRRGIGGDWNPAKYPRLSIVKDGIVYNAMTKFWKWGGEIAGNTKDVMHFSVTGY